VVLVPSRGRPHTVAEIAKAFQDTCGSYEVELLFIVDHNDPTLVDYLFAVQEQKHWIGARVFQQPGGSMVAALNAGAEYALQTYPDADGIAFMGDDHRPRSEDWDTAYLEALTDLGTGIVYGDDLLQGERLPTQCAMTADIIRALGYMSPPNLTHLAVDNAWLALGKAADCIRYLPDVVIEHLHPVAGKADWDTGYRRVNSQAMYRRDLLEFDRWEREDLPAAADAVRALRSEVRA
jgi:hypothetical protein